MDAPAAGLQGAAAAPGVEEGKSALPGPPGLPERPDPRRQHGEERRRSRSPPPRGYERERDRERERERERGRGYPSDRGYDGYEGRGRGYDDRYRDRYRRRPRTPSPPPLSERKRRRPTYFDMTEPPPEILAMQNSGGQAAAQRMGMPPGAPGFPGGPPGAGMAAPGMRPPGGAPGAPGVPALMPIQNQLQTRHARRVYVGGLPPVCTDETLKSFFNGALVAVNGVIDEKADPVMNVYLNREKAFAFVEFRTVEEASNAMALDAIKFEGAMLRVRRPNDYKEQEAAALGPCRPNPKLNLAALGLGFGMPPPMMMPMPMPGPGMGPMPGPMPGGNLGGGPALTKQNDPDRVFIGGLPYYLTEEQVTSLVEPFGKLATIDLIKNPDTQQSKGYAFITFEDRSVVDGACDGLNGMLVGDKKLTVRRASEGANKGGPMAGPPRMGGPPLGFPPGPMGVPGMPPGMPGMPPVGMPPPMGGVGPMPFGVPSKILCIKNAVTEEELKDDEEYADVCADMQQECSQYGTLVALTIPRKSEGAGLVLLEYDDVAAAGAAQRVLHGRKCSGNAVEARFLQQAEYDKLKQE